MTMRALLVVGLVACGSPAKPPVKPVPPAAPVVKAEPLWPVEMRVMTWTPDGLVQVGTLPDAAPAQAPATPWYVEPVRAIDEATLARVLVAVRRAHVPGLSLRGQPVTASWITKLVELPELSALVLDETDVDGPMLQTTQLSLKRLYLARTRIDDAALAWIAKSQTLEVIDVEDCRIGDAGITALAGITGLRAINASGTKITDAGGAQLGKLDKLEVVDLGRTLVGVKTVAALAPRALHQLFLDRTHAGRAVAKLAGMAPRIERVDVSSLVGYRPTDADVAWMATAGNLIEIGLSRARVTDALVLKLATLPRLREIRLAGTNVTTKSIEKLVRPDLEEIDLAETAVTDANASALIVLPKLRLLRLDKTAITDAGMTAPGPALVELYLSNTKVTDAGMAILDATPRLEALGLGHTAVLDATLARIAKLSELRTLVLSGTRPDPGVFVELGKLAKLERLYVDETHAEATLVTALQGRALRVLHIAATSVNDEALPALRTFALLDELTIGDTRLLGFAGDISAWPRLRTLSMLGLEIGDAALPAIARAKQLERLDLSSTNVTNPAPLAALPALVELGLSQTKLTTEGKTAANALQKRGVIVVR
jgi:Leucine-rich repeat (LRR) protein